MTGSTSETARRIRPLSKPRDPGSSSRPGRRQPASQPLVGVDRVPTGLPEYEQPLSLQPRRVYLTTSWWCRASPCIAGSPTSPSLVRGSCSSGRSFASGFLPTPPHGDAVASG